MAADRSFDPDDILTLDHWRLHFGQAGDGLVIIDSGQIVQWASEPGFSPGTPVLRAVHEDDAGALQGMLVSEPAGPVWLRVRPDIDTVRWTFVVAIPWEGGWALHLRHAINLDPAGKAAGVDSGTGIAGREEALNEVAWLLSATPRTGKEIAVVCGGLDGFSSINEEFGQLAGDEILRIVAGRISDSLRSGDLVARLDGDRMLIVLRGVHHLRGAIRVANKIRVAVEDPIQLAGGEIAVTISLGVTLISRGESVDAVMDRAEGAMDLAKEAGRNAIRSNPLI